MMLNNKKLQRALLIAVAIGLFSLPFFWFGESLFLGGDDNKAYFYDVTNYLKHIPLYSWVDSGALGTFTPQQFAIFYLSLIYLLNLILPNFVVQHIFYGLVLSLSFIFQYKFVKTLLISLIKNKNSTNIYIASFLSAIFYIFVPMGFHLLWRQPNHMTYSLLLFPILLYFFLKSINEDKLKHLLLMGVAFLLLSMVILPIIPATVAFIGGFILFFLLYSYKEKKIKIFLKNFLILLLISVASLAFWLAPFLQGNLSKSQETMVAISLTEEVKTAKAQYAENLIAESANILFPLITQIDYPSYQRYDLNYYQTIRKYVVIEITLVFLLCIIVSLLFLKKYNKNFKFVYLSLFTVILVYMACSSVRINEYFVDFWIWCMNNIPLFTMWRSLPFFHIPYVVFYSALLALALFMIMEAAKKVSHKKILFAVFMISLLIMGTPLILGKPSIGPASLQKDFSSVVAVPNELSKILDEVRKLPANYKMLNFPIANQEYLVFRDNKGGIFEGPSIVNQLTGKTHFSGLISFRNSYTNFYDAMIDVILFPEDKNYIQKIFSTFNLKYILYSKDEELVEKIDYPFNYSQKHVHDAFRDYKNYKEVISDNFSILAENEGYILYEYNKDILPIVFTTNDYTLASTRKLSRVHNGTIYHKIFKNPFFGIDKNVVIYDNGKLFQDVIDKIQNSSSYYVPLIPNITTNKNISDDLQKLNEYNLFVTQDGEYDLYSNIKNFDVLIKYDRERGWLLKFTTRPRNFTLRNIENPEDEKHFTATGTETESIQEIRKERTLTLRIFNKSLYLTADKYTDWQYVGLVNVDQINTVQAISEIASDIEFPDFSNLYNWSPYPCYREGDGNKFEASLSKDSVDGKKSLLLGADKGNNTCAFADMVGFQDNSMYKISFYYKNLEGNVAEFSACSDRRGVCLTDKLEDNDNEWSYHEILYEPEKDDREVRMFLYSNSVDKKPTRNLFNNIKVTLYNKHSIKLERDQMFYLQKDKTFLEKGEYIINFERKEKDYGQENPRFPKFSEEEFKMWGKDDCLSDSIGKAEIRFELSDDSVDEGKSYLISANNNHIACTYADMLNFEANTIYKISFYYKNVRGNPAEFSICSYKNSSCDIIEDVKENYGVWNYFETYYRPYDSAEYGTRLFIYANAKNRKKTTVLYSNVQVEKFDQAPLYSFLMQTGKEPLQTDQSPIVEHKRINIEKHRLKIKNLTSSRLLTLLENYDPNWKAYVVKPKQEENENVAFAEAKDRLGHSGASKEMVEDFKNKGWITASGDKFISKEIYGTIQNDNLASGHVWDTWFKEPLPEENHIFVNGYANSWWIDLETLEKEGKVQKNADGSYNLEMIIEFWPQKMFWVGFFVTICFILFVIGYFVRLKRCTQK